MPAVSNARLREINAGKWENKRFVDLPELFPDAYAVWMIPGGTKEAMDALSSGGNCAISELNYVDGGFWVVSSNYTEHLSGFSTESPSNM